MQAMQAVLEKVIEKITPSEKEAGEAREMFGKIRDFVKSGFSVDAGLMGSVAKETFLSEDKDMDIFLMFPKSVPREELETQGLAIGKAVFKKFNKGRFQISYAEHPYTEGTIGKFHIEVVPAYIIKDATELQSAVDRTPLHTEYVQKHLKNKEQVLLLKKFLKGIGCYGSDLRREGFSGYACEVLIIKYGSFEGTLRAVQGYRHQEIVDIENHHSKQDAHKIRKMFSGQPLILIDPVDRNRNVTAVLSAERLARFMFYAGRFLEKPSESYFFPPKETIDKKEAFDFYKKAGTTVIAMTFKKPEIIEDILYPQLRRLAGNVATHAKHAGFGVLDEWIFADEECGFALEVKDSVIPGYFVVEGPGVFNPREHQKRFVSTHKAVWFRREKYLALAKRDETEISRLLKKILGGSKKSMHDRGIPDNFIAPILSGVKLLSGKEVLKLRSAEFWKGAGKERVK